MLHRYNALPLPQNTASYHHLYPVPLQASLSITCKTQPLTPISMVLELCAVLCALPLPENTASYQQLYPVLLHAPPSITCRTHPLTQSQQNTASHPNPSRTQLLTKTPAPKPLHQNPCTKIPAPSAACLTLPTQPATKSTHSVPCSRHA